MDTMDDGIKDQNKWSLDENQPWNEPDRVTDNERLLGGLCYLSQLFIPAILPAILLLTEETKNSLFVRYHAVHGLALIALSFLYSLGALFVFILSVMITGCAVCIVWVIFLPPLIVLVYYGWQAFTGRASVMPWLSQFLQDNNWL